MGELSFLSLQDTGGWLLQQGERQDHRLPQRPAVPLDDAEFG